jgi:hypothetical protein
MRVMQKLSGSPDQEFDKTPWGLKHFAAGGKEAITGG